MKNYTITVNGTGLQCIRRGGDFRRSRSCACCSCSGTCCRSRTRSSACSCCRSGSCR